MGKAVQTQKVRIYVPTQQAKEENCKKSAVRSKTQQKYRWKYMWP